MNKSLRSIIVTLVVILAVFLVIIEVGGNLLNIDRFKTGENPVLRFVFVIIGLLIALAIYYFTQKSKIWEVGTREVVWMAIGAALYAILSWLFNGSVFVVPSLSQVALRPAIAIPMFFGFTFGPVVGFFTGAVGNMFGDALTGFGLSPQWSIGNGLIGFVAGLAMLFPDRKKSLNNILYVSGGLTVIALIIYLLNQSLPNMTYFDAANNIFGDATISPLAGFSLLIGFVIVVLVRVVFGKNLNIASAVLWSMLANIVGIGFASLSDIWINGFSLPAAIVGEFLPAAGPNLIFAAILVPMLVAAYAAVQRQSGR